MPEDIIPIITSIVAIVATAVGIISGARKGEVETLQKSFDALNGAFASLKKSFDELQEENARMSLKAKESEAKIEKLENEMSELQTGIETLIKQIHELGQRPAWTPRNFSTAPLAERKKPTW